MLSLSADQSRIDQPSPTLHPECAWSLPIAVKPIKLAIIDPCPTLYQSLERLSGGQSQIQIVGKASCPADLLAESFAANFDVALISIDRPEVRAAEICRWMALEYPNTKIILVSAYNWDTVIVAAFYLQAVGVIFRNMQAQHILEAIEQSITGPIFTREQLQMVQAWENRIGFKLRSLSGSEWQALKMILNGLPDCEMGRRLSIDQGELEAFLTELARKLDLPSRALLFTFCFQEHLDIVTPLSSSFQNKFEKRKSYENFGDERRWGF